ncbi:hypothetical protein Tco_0324524 [Tanacetum coccineum]
MLVYMLQLRMKLFASNYEPMVVRKDALAQGADGLGLMKNEDHQVLGNEQKLEKDASDYTKVDDDGVEFSPEGGGYFPIMGDETKKDKCYIFLLLLIICIQGAGLDELKHDLSTEEFIAQKCKDVIVKNKREIIRANIEPNKAGSEEVADLDPDQLPTLAFVVLVEIFPASNDLSNSEALTLGSVIPPFRLDHAFEFLFWNLYVKYSKEFLFPYPADQDLFTSGASLEDKRIMALDSEDGLAHPNINPLLVPKDLLLFSKNLLLLSKNLLMLSWKWANGKGMSWRFS